MYVNLAKTYASVFDVMCYVLLDLFESLVMNQVVKPY